VKLLIWDFDGTLAHRRGETGWSLLLAEALDAEEPGHGRAAEACRVLGVTAKSRDRPRTTFPNAEVTDLIQVGNSAREYCCPRHVGRPLATTRKSSWLTTRNGTSLLKNATLQACTGSTPKTR